MQAKRKQITYLSRDGKKHPDAKSATRHDYELDVLKLASVGEAEIRDALIYKNVEVANIIVGIGNRITSYKTDNGLARKRVLKSVVDLSSDGSAPIATEDQASLALSGEPAASAEKVEDPSGPDDPAAVTEQSATEGHTLVDETPAPTLEREQRPEPVLIKAPSRRVR